MNGSPPEQTVATTLKGAAAKTRRGVSLVATASVALTAMVVVQEVLGLFSPRPWVKAALLAFVACAGLLVDRLRYRHSVQLFQAADWRRMQRLLSVWPPKPLRSTHPLALGLFPQPWTMTAGVVELPPYVPRDFDSDVVEALQRSRLVLLFGPARAGKSRSAYEAARQAFGERQVVIPESGAALAELAQDPPDEWPLANSVLWLDDLERFVASLGAAELAFVGAGSTPVIATVRGETYHRWLRASGEIGDKARRLLASASSVEVGSTLSGAERAEADRLYQDEDFTHGIGEAFVAHWEHGHDATAPLLDPPASPPPRRPRIADRLWLGAVAVTVCSALLFGGLWILGGFSAAHTPPLSTQLDGARHAAEQKGIEVNQLRADFHGPRSFVMYPRPGSTGTNVLRLYDVAGGRLGRPLIDLRLTGVAADYGFENPRVVDIDQSGTRELIADYFAPVSLTPVRLPIIVAWDDKASRYVLEPLLAAPPSLPRRPHGARRPFPAAIRLTGEPPTHVGFGVSSFAVVPSTSLLVTGTELPTRSSPTTALLAVNVLQVNLRGGKPTLRRLCSFEHPDGLLTVRVPIASDADYASALRHVYASLVPRLPGREDPHSTDCFQGE